jgi:hypothetical protein
MPTWRRAKEKSVEDIYKDIEDHAEDFSNGDGGSYSQSPYKEDYYGIFFACYYNGHCGIQAHRRYKTKRGKIDQFVVSGAAIERLLDRTLLKGKRMSRYNKMMIRDFAMWWDEWTFALDELPNIVPRKYFRKRRTQTDAKDDN